jgi:hypothetical protein
MKLFVPSFLGRRGRNRVRQAFQVALLWGQHTLGIPALALLATVAAMLPIQFGVEALVSPLARAPWVGSVAGLGVACVGGFLVSNRVSARLDRPAWRRRVAWVARAAYSARRQKMRRAWRTADFLYGVTLYDQQVKAGKTETAFVPEALVATQALRNVSSAGVVSLIGPTSPLFRRTMAETVGCVPAPTVAALQTLGVSVAGGTCLSFIEPGLLGVSLPKRMPSEPSFANQFGALYLRDQKRVVVGEFCLHKDATHDVNPVALPQKILDAIWVWCDPSSTRESVLHEIGHAAGHNFGALLGVPYVSATPAFQRAIDLDRARARATPDVWPVTISDVSKTFLLEGGSVAAEELFAMTAEMLLNRTSQYRSLVAVFPHCYAFQHAFQHDVAAAARADALPHLRERLAWVERSDDDVIARAKALPRRLSGRLIL